MKDMISSLYMFGCDLVLGCRFGGRERGRGGREVTTGSSGLVREARKLSRVYECWYTGCGNVIGGAVLVADVDCVPLLEFVCFVFAL